MPETIQAYLEAVREQIRWKRARPVLIQELERHLEDQRDAFLGEGKSPEEAERLAVLDMGDPVTVGTELDAVHRPRPQWGLLGLTFALAVTGVVLRMEFIRTDPNSSGEQVLVKGLIYLAALGLGTAALLGMYFLDVSRLVRHGRAVYIGALAAGVLTLPLTRVAVSYYTRYVVLFYPIVYALWLYSFRGRGWRGFALTVSGGVPLAAVCCMAPFTTGLLLLLFSGLVLTLFAAARDWFGIGRWKGIGAALAVPAAMLTLLISRGYLNSFRSRVQIALHPELDPMGSGFIGQILRLFWEDVPPLRQHGSVGTAVHAGARVRVLTGGSQEMRPIDFSHDFLPASMAVQWGWLPFLLLAAALTALLVWLLVKGLRQKYIPGRFVVLAVVLTLGLQTLFSVALNLGFVFFSAGLPLIVGNLQTVVDMALIGLALSVFRGDSIAREEPVGPQRPRRRLRIRIELQA